MINMCNNAEIPYIGCGNLQETIFANSSSELDVEVRRGGLGLNTSSSGLAEDAQFRAPSRVNNIEFRSGDTIAAMKMELNWL